MITKARQRAIYDRLFCSELIEFLDTEHGRFDLVVAADVLVYFGDLAPVFRAVRNILKGVQLFAFTVEGTEDAAFALKASRRYGHSIDYLNTLANQYQFSVETMESSVLREELGDSVHGYQVVMRAC